MKRTVSVNIKGMNFLIEEDAYQVLQDYLDRLAHVLRNDRGSKEIIEDIELRIAELCSSKLNDRKQVIEIEDIQSILETLGDPAQYIDDDEETTETFSKTKFESGKSSQDKRLFRDTDNATIAGVCAGIANFFNIDVVIIRAIFVIVFLFGGFGFPLYIILWIIVPKANNSIDKLRMRGKAITIDSVREEVETAAERLNKETKTFADRIRKDDNYTKRLSNFGRLINGAFGIGMICFGLFLLVMFLIFGVGGMEFIPVQSDNGFLSFSDFGKLVLANEHDYQWAWIGTMIVAFSTILFILLLGVKVLFRIRNSWSKISLGLLFSTGFIGTIICIFIAAKTGREMSIEGEIEREAASIFTEELSIITHQSTLHPSSDFQVKSNGKFGMLGLKGANVIESGIHMEYRLSKDSLFHVYQNFSAHSHSHKDALNKAKNIQHTITFEDSLLHLPSFYSFPRKDRLRDQEVYVIIEIPAGKTVRINNHLIRLGSKDHIDHVKDHQLEEEGYIKGDGEYNHWD